MKRTVLAFLTIMLYNDAHTEQNTGKPASIWRETDAGAGRMKSRLCRCWEGRE